jgi:nucleoside-diphosphate-sugar epimerase
MKMITNPLSADLDHILDHTRGLWEELRGERIFITGGTGFFGCWLLESFAWANDRLGLNASALVLTRDPDAFRKKVPHLATHLAIHFHSGDVRSFEFPVGSFTHIIHAATESSVKLNSESPLLMLETIVDGTRRTLEFARQSGAKKILLTSSGAVYGKQPQEMTLIPEDYQGAPDPTDPLCAYGEGKRVAETLFSMYAGKYGFESKIARCFSFVGLYLPLDIHFAIGNFIRDGLNGGPIIIKGNGTPIRSYLYAADLAIWLWTILMRGKTSRPYNVGSDECQSIADTGRMVARAFAPPLKVDIRGKVYPDQEVERYIPSTSRAKEELGLTSYFPFQDALIRTIQSLGGSK